MLFLKEYSFLRILNRKLVSLAVVVAMSVCVLQIDNMATISTSPSNNAVITESTTLVHVSHIPQVCDLASQKYTNQTKNTSDIPIPQSQANIVFYQPPQLILDQLTFQTPRNGKIYIKNLTLLI